MEARASAASSVEKALPSSSKANRSTSPIVGETRAIASMHSPAGTSTKAPTRSPSDAMSAPITRSGPAPASAARCASRPSRVLPSMRSGSARSASGAGAPGEAVAPARQAGATASRAASAQAARAGEGRAAHAGLEGRSAGGGAGEGRDAGCLGRKVVGSSGRSWRATRFYFRAGTASRARPPVARRAVRRGAPSPSRRAGAPRRLGGRVTPPPPRRRAARASGPRAR